MTNAVQLHEAIEKIEAIMLQMPQVDLPVNHHFAEGLYARELHIPAGVTLTGRVHKRENLNILSKGKMLLYAEHGAVEIDAPYTVVSPAGTKRMAYAVTDCVWTTMFVTNETDVDVILEEFTTITMQEYLSYASTQQLLGA